MKIIDITGEIKEGMWSYRLPFPAFSMSPLPDADWITTTDRVYCEIFNGLHSQTGTYLETPAHFYGNDKCYLLADVPLDKLYNQRCRIINLSPKLFDNADKRLPITAKMLEDAAGDEPFNEGDSLLIGTGWGKYWFDDCYMKNSPYFTFDAMQWLISKKPFILGGDIPLWENLDNLEGFFEDFYKADILMLAPCVNLEKVTKTQCNLTVLPMNVPGTSCAPTRAILTQLD